MTPTSSPSTPPAQPPATNGKTPKAQARSAVRQKQEDGIGEVVTLGRGLSTLKIQQSADKENAHPEGKCTGESPLIDRVPADGVTMRKKKGRPKARTVATDTELATRASRLSQENERLQIALLNARSRLQFTSTVAAKRSRKIVYLQRRLSECMTPEEVEAPGIETEVSADAKCIIKIPGGKQAPTQQSTSEASSSSSRSSDPNRSEGGESDASEEVQNKKQKNYKPNVSLGADPILAHNTGCQKLKDQLHAKETHVVIAETISDQRKQQIEALKQQVQELTCMLEDTRAELRGVQADVELAEKRVAYHQQKQEPAQGSLDDLEAHYQQQQQESGHESLDDLAVMFNAQQQDFPNTTPALNAQLVEHYAQSGNMGLQQSMKAALRAHRGLLVSSTQEAAAICKRYLQRQPHQQQQQQQYIGKRPREVSPNPEGVEGTTASGHMLKAIQNLHKAGGQMKPKFSESMGEAAYSTWVYELETLIALYAGTSWHEHEAAVVKACTTALSRDVLKLWRGNVEQSTNPTWSGFLKWTESLLAVEIQTEAEKALDTLLNQELQQGSESIQKHNVAFNRLVQKLQGNTAQNQYTLMQMYKKSLSDLYVPHAQYDATGGVFSNLADMQQHLLKQEGMIKNQARDGALFKEKLKPRFKGEKKKKYLYRGAAQTPTKPPSTPSVAAVQGQIPETQPRRKPQARPEQLRGDPHDPCMKNQHISNEQYSWLLKKGFCTFCTKPRLECCPSTTDRCLVKHPVERGGKADVQGCPGWQR